MKKKEKVILNLKEPGRGLIGAAVRQFNTIDHESTPNFDGQSQEGRGRRKSSIIPVDYAAIAVANGAGQQHRTIEDLNTSPIFDDDYVLLPYDS